jgi:16S rRNA (uracil1498-N3)-methyltransferase
LAPDAAPALIYLPDLPGPGARLTLPPPDAHYLARVCRARAGERAEATDGRGARATLRLLEVRGRVVAEVESLHREEPGRRSWVLCGVPEGERADWLVEKLAELGVERLVPVDGARGEWKKLGGRHARWERLAIAALRQSRRVHRLTVAEPLPLAQALGSLPAGCERWIADPSGARAEPARQVEAHLCVGLVGCSGGFEPEELAMALGEGFKPMRLSDGRLRTETAALAWAAWWSAAGD